MDQFFLYQSFGSASPIRKQRERGDFDWKSLIEFSIGSRFWTRPEPEPEKTRTRSDPTRRPEKDPKRPESMKLFFLSAKFYSVGISPKYLPFDSNVSCKMIYKSKTPNRSQAPVINFLLVFAGVRRVEREFTTRFKAENKRSQATAPAGIEKIICGTLRSVRRQASIF